MVALTIASYILLGFVWGVVLILVILPLTCSRHPKLRVVLGAMLHHALCVSGDREYQIMKRALEVVRIRASVGSKMMSFTHTTPEIVDLSEARRTRNRH